MGLVSRPRALQVGSFLASLGLWLAFSPCAAGEEPASRSDGEFELIRDPRFQGGFKLLDPKPGKKVVLGFLQWGGLTEQPFWELAQWNSKFSLAGVLPQRLASGAARYANQAKTVIVGPAGAEEADLILGVDSRPEYAGRARQKGEPWPHLLVSQRLPDCPPLTELESLRFGISARLRHSEHVEPPGYTPRLHTAHYLIHFTVQNLKRGSSGYGDFLWFGIPLYDERAAIPPRHVAQDDASRKLIYCPGGEAYTTESLHGGQWVRIERDLLPLVREALQAAWDRGFLKDSQDSADYQLGGMNMGWEVSGLSNAELQIRDLRLVAVAKGRREGAGATRDSDSLRQGGKTPMNTTERRPPEAKPSKDELAAKLISAGAVEHVYKKIGDIELKLYIFSPASHKPEERSPAIVFFHGGGFSGGHPSSYVDQCKHFASRGMVAIAAGYRLTKEHGITPLECCLDAKSAIRWVRAHAEELKIDANRVAVGGGSAGGFMALFAALETKHDEAGDERSLSCVPNALVLFNPGVEATAEKAKARFGEEGVQLALELSPYNNVKSGAPPTIIFHGTADTTVPFESILRFQKRTREMGNRCDVVPYEGRQHAFFNRELDKTDVILKSDDFLTGLGYLEKQGRSAA